MPLPDDMSNLPLLNPQERPDWDVYFMELALLARTRSTCLRRQVGAVIVKERSILATGYNGAPKSMLHCQDTGCLRNSMGVPSGQRHELCRGLHAEQNAIVQAAYHGVSIKNATLYCTTHPCSICIKMLINAGVEKVFYLEGYADDLSKAFIEEIGMPVEKISSLKRFQRL